MTNEEALEVSALVAELWPTPVMTGVRQAFFARSLTVIGAQRRAMDAVAKLFVDARFQPTPGDIIDAALGVDDGVVAGWLTIIDVANELGAGRRPLVQLEPTARQAMAGASLTFGQIAAADDRGRESLRRRFVEAYRDAIRAAAAGELRTGETRELTR